MKKILFYTLLISIVLSCKNQTQGATEQEHQHTVGKANDTSTKKTLSPHTFAMNMIGDAHIHIDYSSPSMRGRIIFGGLLPFGEVWQLGAHKATWFETNKDLLIDNKVLKAGKYGLFTIPSKEEWTVIFNTNWDQFGEADYDQKDDVLRFKVKPEYTENAVENLIYKVARLSDSEGKVSLSWENISIGFKLKVE
jgi:hypothetical protein